MARDSDALALLSAGEIDLMFLGQDKVEEMELAGQLKEYTAVDAVDMNCQLVLAGLRKNIDTIPTRLEERELLTVATSYPYTLGQFALRNSLNLVTSWQPDGSCEAYAATDRADLVFDICNTGKTLAANDLVVYCTGERLSLFVLTAAQVRAPKASELESSLQDIAEQLRQRYKQSRQNTKTTYTTELFSDKNKLIKKLGEEFAELMQAILRKPSNKTELVSEAADLLYVIQVALTEQGLTLGDVLKEDIRRGSDAI